MKLPLLIVCSLALSACHSTALSPTPNSEVRCDSATLKLIDDHVSSGDGLGHGPDIGSLEWYHTIERRLQISDDPQRPAPQTDSWCRYLLQQLALTPATTKS